MYYIRKYSDCWAIHDGQTGFNSKLKPEEIVQVAEKFSSPQDDKVIVLYTDKITNIQININNNSQH